MNWLEEWAKLNVIKIWIGLGIFALVILYAIIYWIVHVGRK